MNNKFCLLLVNYKGILLLNALVKNNILPNLVITYKDKNSPCNSYENIIETCEKYNINILKSRKFEEDKIASEYKYVFAIGWQFMLKLQSNLIVIHDSYLPEFKGFSPTINYLINGYDYLGITAIQPTLKVDTGPIYYQEKINIKYPIKLKEAFEKLNDLYVNAVKFIINSDNLQLKEMSEKNESFCSWRNLNDMYINWSWDLFKIKRFIDALGFPYSGAKSYLIIDENKYTIQILDSEIIENKEIIDRNDHIGKIFELNNNNPVIICKNGLLKITEYEFENNQDLKITKLKSKLI
jgi:methionyl-tRNA formyltransferase